MKIECAYDVLVVIHRDERLARELSPFESLHTKEEADALYGPLGDEARCWLSAAHRTETTWDRYETRKRLGLPWPPPHIDIIERAMELACTPAAREEK